MKTTVKIVNIEPSIMLFESIHLLISVVIALVIGHFFDCYTTSISLSIITGGLVDLDHLLDYYLCYGNKLNLKNFLNGKQFQTSGKAYIALHSYEIVIILLLLYFLNKKNYFFILGVALLAHLLFDILHNRTKWYGYFLIYRASNKFNLKSLGCFDE